MVHSMADKQIHPFDFSKIDKISSRQMLITESLIKHFPQFSETKEIAPFFIEALKRDLGLNLSLRFSGWEETTYKDFISSLSSPCVAVLLKMQPTEQRVVLDLDYALARMIVDRLLGGEGDFPHEFAPFSQVEEGVLEFALLKALSQLKEAPGMEGSTSLRIVKTVHESKMLVDSSSPDESGCIFKFYLGLGERGGYFQMYFPHPLVEGLFLREDSVVDWANPSQAGALEERLGRISHIKTSLWSEIGRVNLMASDLGQLEKGDVILFDETSAAMGPHGLTGKTVLRAGETSAEGFLAELVDAEGKVVAKILDYYGGE
jgi:flagellar motor switch protein FliM